MVYYQPILLALADVFIFVAIPSGRERVRVGVGIDRKIFVKALLSKIHRYSIYFRETHFLTDFYFRITLTTCLQPVDNFG